MATYDEFMKSFGLGAQTGQSGLANINLPSELVLFGTKSPTTTYAPNKNIQYSKTSTYSPTKTLSSVFAPVSSYTSSYSPQSVYSPQLIFNSPYASSGVESSLSPYQSSGLYSAPASSAMSTPSVANYPTQSNKPALDTAGNTTFDFSALLPFVAVGAVLYFTLRTGGGKK